MIGVLTAYTIELRLFAAAHGSAFESRDCAACKRMAEQLAEWLAAHGEPVAEVNDGR